MSAISLKSITGITSITTPAAPDNQITLHTLPNTVERVRITSDGKVGIGTNVGLTDILTVNDTNPKISMRDGGTERAFLHVDGSDDFIINNKSISNLIFKTQDAERVRITSGGQVQINTDGGSGALTLGASQDFRLYHDANGPTIFSDTGNQGFKLQIKELNLTEYTGSTTRLKITSTGEVNIGGNYTQTTAPLCVTTDANDFGIRLMTGSKKVVDILNNDAVGSCEIRGYYNNNSGTQGEGFRLEANGATFFNPGGNSGLQINSSGEVSIGTGSGGKTLTLYGTSSSSFRISKSGVLAYDHTFDGSSYTIANNNGSAGIPIIIGTKTAGGESLRINSSGRVGINTTTDSMDGVTGNLNIANDNFNNHTVINLSRNTASDRAQIRFSNPNGNIGSINTFGSDFAIYASNDIIFGASNSEKFRIASGGNIGINEDSPDKILHISHSSSPTIRLENTDTSLTSGQVVGNIEFKAVDPSGIGANVIGSVESFSDSSVGGSYGLKFKVSTSSSANYEAMRIAQNGYVSLGGKVPDAHFHIEKLTPELRVQSTNTNLGQGGTVCTYSHHTSDPTTPTGVGEVFRLKTYSANANGADYTTELVSRAGSGGGESRIALGQSALGAISFSTHASGSAVERLRITSGGKIGIGHHISTQITNGGSELTIRPADDGGILIGRPGDTVAPINKALTLTTTTTGSEAYHTKYHTYNCNSIFATYQGGGTGGNFIFKTGVGSGQEAEKLRITPGGHLVTGGATPPNQATSDGSVFLKNDATLGFLSQGGSLTFNAYYNGGWKYYTSGDAHILWGSGDGINLSMAGAGTANNAVSFSRAFQVTTTKAFHFGSQTSLGKYGDNVQGCSWYDEKNSWQQGQNGSIGWSMWYLNKIGGSDNRLIQFNSSGSNIGYIVRSGSNVAYQTSSDYRLKKDVVALPNGIDRVKQLRPVAFKWIADDSDMEGFLAHEAQEICPYAVSGTKDEVATEDHGDRKKGDMIVQAIDYGEFTPLLTAAMKELIAKVETLEAEVAALKGS